LVKDSEDPALLEGFVAMFPDAPQLNLAKLKLMALASREPKAEPSASQAETPVTSVPDHPAETLSDSENVEVLSGEAAKKQLLETKSCDGCDLSGTSLQRSNLTSANLQRANLRDANLYQANLGYAQLMNTDLQRANLHEADLFKIYLMGSNLSGADLRETDLREADLTGADLREANLTESDLTEANLVGAILERAIFCKTTMPNGLINNSDCDRNSSKESSSPPEKTDQQVIGRGMDYSTYQAMEQNSSDVIGCGFFHVGCEEKALTFPAYQPDFHIKGYRRVNLWGKDRPWTNTELVIEKGDKVYFYGTGEVTICVNCSMKGPRNLLSGLIDLKVGKGSNRDGLLNNFQRIHAFTKQVKSVGEAFQASYNMIFEGELYLTVRDGDIYPPTKNLHDGNSGVYILDIFVIDPDQEEGFGRFRNALFEANPNDSNVKAYLGRR